VAESAFETSSWPGAWTPMPYPNQAETQGSFNVIQNETESASAS
jgi:hypothetical protein